MRAATSKAASLPVLGADAEDVVLADIYPGMGAVGAIRTGVSASASLHSLVVRADMPFFNAFLLRRLMELSTGEN